MSYDVTNMSKGLLIIVHFVMSAIISAVRVGRDVLWKMLLAYAAPN